jgi:hypothetical protein
VNRNIDSLPAVCCAVPSYAQQSWLERLPRSANSRRTQTDRRTASAALEQQQVSTNDPAAEALLALLDYSLAHPHQQQLGGPGGHPVLRLLLTRLQDGSAPGSRGDNFKLGLVVEGGGMRGIVTGAMLMGLQDMGMLNVFDAVYGERGPATCAVVGRDGGLCWLVLAVGYSS